MTDSELLRKFQSPNFDEDKDNLAHLICMCKNDWDKVLNTNDDTKEYLNFSDDAISNWVDLVTYFKKISEDEIKIGDGIIIEEGQKNDLKVPTNSKSAWQILRNRLKDSDKYTMDELQAHEKETLDILNRLSSKTKDGAVKGVVMGYVQSGKTTSMESLITMAADHGWNLFILLSGTIENLRQQTIIRLKKDIEYGKAGNIHWKFLPEYDDSLNTIVESGNRIVTICLKNTKRLNDLYEWIHSEPDYVRQKLKILFIDDEADQASLNSKNISKEERSRINDWIVKLVNQTEYGAMNYVGYTATPYGNFLNEYGDDTLYPKDFIKLLNKSTQYIGCSEIFGEYNANEEEGKETLNIIRNIKSKKDNDDVNELEMIRKIEKDQSEVLPESLKDAICWFICTVGVRRFQNVVKPVSMLVHTDRMVSKQEEVYKAMKNWLISMDKDELLEKCREIYLKETAAFTKDDFMKVMTRYTKKVEDYPLFEQIEEYIKELISNEISMAKILDTKKLEFGKGIIFAVDNAGKINKDDNEQARLIYPEEGQVDFATAFIVIGGNTLSRGLTLEGLTTTYFCRKTQQMDTLMQMGRWFGYRFGYELLPRIWMDSDNRIKFTDLTYVEERLREDIKKYVRGGLQPSQYGPLISKSHVVGLNITSKNKMQLAKDAAMNFVGAKAQLTFFDKDENIQLNNLQAFENFISKVGNFEETHISGNLVSKNVSFDLIKSELLSKMKFNNRANFFSTIDTFIEWVDKEIPNDKKLEKWNVIVVGTNSDGAEWDVCGHKIHMVQRNPLKGYEDEQVYAIGALRNTKDIISDIDKDTCDKEELKDEKSMIEFREKIQVPQILLYRIDKNSQPKNGERRIPLNSKNDLVGLYLFLPSTREYKDYVSAVTIKIPEIVEDEKEEED